MQNTVKQSHVIFCKTFDGFLIKIEALKGVQWMCPWWSVSTSTHKYISPPHDYVCLYLSLLLVFAFEFVFEDRHVGARPGIFVFSDKTGAETFEPPVFVFLFVILLVHLSEFEERHVGARPGRFVFSDKNSGLRPLGRWQSGHALHFRFVFQIGICIQPIQLSNKETLRAKLFTGIVAVFVFVFGFVSKCKILTFFE